MHSSHTICRRQRENLTNLRFFAESLLDINIKTIIRTKKHPFMTKGCFLECFFQLLCIKVMPKNQSMMQLINKIGITITF